MSPTRAIIELRDVSYRQSDGRLCADRLNFSLYPGQSVAITGMNGCGKSTLLSVIMGLRTLTSGEVTLFGHPCRCEADFSRFRTRIGLVFQDPDDQLFCPTVIEDVSFGPLNQGLTPTGALSIARKTLERLEIAHLADRVCYQLSGGQKRIVALATVLAMEPQVLILEEPTNDLDEASTRHLLQTLKSLSLPMILVSHDPGVRAQLADRQYLLQQGVMTPVSQG